jgi:hypothetical protein
VSPLASATEEPLPALGWAAAFRFIAVERDVRERRTPNWLTVPAFTLFVARGAWLGGASGAAASSPSADAASSILAGRTRRPEAGERRDTLEVDPEQAPKLTYTSHQGKLQLAPRNPTDHDSTGHPGFDR